MTRLPVVPDILEEHLEELAFLSLQRRKLAFDWETFPRELRAHDRRIEAHRAALKLGGAESARIARARLEDAVMDWEIYASLRIWFETEAPSGETLREVLLARLGDDPEPSIPKAAGWREAYRALPPGRAEELLRLDVPAATAIAVDAAGWHGALDAKGADRFASHSAPAVRRGVARTLGAARFDPARALDRLLGDPETEVRHAALGSRLLRDPRGTHEMVRGRVAAADDFELRVLGLLGDANDLRGLASRARETPAAARALGDLRDPRALDVLLELARGKDADLAAAALDGVATIAGWPAGREGADDLDVEEMAAHVAACRSALGDAPRWLRGIAYPPRNSEEITTEAAWRLAIESDDPERGRRLREVPDGFFTGAPVEEALCGE
ncbi:MAG: hypothetical protein R3B81_09840 [bacterium]